MLLGESSWKKNISRIWNGKTYRTYRNSPNHGALKPTLTILSQFPLNHGYERRAMHTRNKRISKALKLSTRWVIFFLGNEIERLGHPIFFRLTHLNKQIVFKKNDRSANICGLILEWSVEQLSWTWKGYLSIKISWGVFVNPAKIALFLEKSSKWSRKVTSGGVAG